MVRPVFGIAFAECMLCSARVRQTRFGKRGLCSANACVRPVFGERGSANAVRQTRLVFGNVFGLWSACSLCLALSMGHPGSKFQISAPDFQISCYLPYFLYLTSRVVDICNTSAPDFRICCYLQYVLHLTSRCYMIYKTSRVSILRPPSVFARSVNAVFGWFAGFGILNHGRPVFTGSQVRLPVHQHVLRVRVFVERCYKSSSVR